MLFYKDAFHSLRQDLQPMYDPGEATAIAREVMEAVTGVSYAKSLTTDCVLDVPVLAQIENSKEALKTGKPLQYVLGYAWFMNRKFMVNENVLIPRPETEELVQWIVDDYNTRDASLTILDIGTGSGCIPISLKLALRNASVTSCDVSKGALSVAAENAQALSANINLKELDFLSAARNQLPKYSVIVSNPPYIPVQEKEMLHTNVRDHEPATALFVPDDDALLFYREIALFGLNHLEEKGAIYCELHKDYAQETAKLFRNTGYNDVELRKDINGHWRMLKASFAQ